MDKYLGLLLSVNPVKSRQKNIGFLQERGMHAMRAEMQDFCGSWFSTPAGRDFLHICFTWGKKAVVFCRAQDGACAQGFFLRENKA